MFKSFIVSSDTFLLWSVFSYFQNKTKTEYLKMMRSCSISQDPTFLTTTGKFFVSAPSVDIVFFFLESFFLAWSYVIKPIIPFNFILVNFHRYIY